MLINGLNFSGQLQAVVKKMFMVWKYSDSPINKKFWAQQSVTKVILIVFWDGKGPLGNISNYFLNNTRTTIIFHCFYKVKN